VPASDWLEPDVVAYLLVQFGSTQKAAVVAMQLPEFSDEFAAQTSATLRIGEDGQPYVGPFSRDSDRAFWKLVEAAVGPNSRYALSLEPDRVEQPNAKKPRHRPPAPIATATVKQLKWELAQREAKPADRELTQEKIAARLSLDDTRVQQAEGLQRVGWDLLRSHPDFPVDEGFVRWPGVRKAAQILASERTEN
jgi:hypothetical protein